MVPFWGTRFDAFGALVFALGFEVVTCFFRFVLKKQSTKNTGFIGRCTCGFRVHHGYVGAVLVLMRNLFPDPWSHVATIIGWGCVISDGVHHFWVLWPLTGSHGFDLVYPANSFPRLALLEERLRGDRKFVWAGIVATMLLVAGFCLAPR